MPAHPFFLTKSSQPTSPTQRRETPQVFDKLLKETFTNISQLAAVPSTDVPPHPSILTAFERLSTGNVLPETTKKQSMEESKSSNSSPDPFHSTAGTNSVGANSLQDQIAGVTFPTTPAVAINALGKYLTNNEVSEILGYKVIYYLGIHAEKVKGDLSLPNYGYDDERNDYKACIGDHLEYRYEILSVIGKGAFGRVLQCYDHKENQHVAIKIIRNARRFHKQAQIELRVLQVLRDQRVPHTVIMLDHFKFRNHECMVFELLDLSLFDYLKQNRFRGFPVMWVRTVALQLVEVLMVMKRNGVIHCDLKPENVLFEDSKKSGIKLIDFGSACYDSAKMYSYIQSRFYRAPEIILGLKYSYPIDMWSLGCLLSELYTGRPLFPGENETDQLLWIMSALGHPPSDMLAEASKKNVFFAANNQVKIVPNSHGTRRTPSSTTLEKLIPSTDQHMFSFIVSKGY